MKHHYPDCQGGPTCNCDEREIMEREMSDTPETNNARRICLDASLPKYVVSADVAEKLERERDEARRLAETWMNAAYSDCDRNALPELPWEEAGDE